MKQPPTPTDRQIGTRLDITNNSVTPGRGWTPFCFHWSWMCLYCRMAATKLSLMMWHGTVSCKKLWLGRWGKCMTSVTEIRCQMTHWSGWLSWNGTRDNTFQIEGISLHTVDAFIVVLPCCYKCNQFQFHVSNFLLFLVSNLLLFSDLWMFSHLHLQLHEL